MESKAPDYLRLIQHDFNDKDVDNLIGHFRDKERRKEFFKEYKELEMLYEIISPDAFLRQYIDDYRALSAMYEVVQKAYTNKVYIDKEFQRKTNELVREHVSACGLQAVDEIIAIDEKTIGIIKNKEGGDNTKIINLIKGIERIAEEQSDDPYLIAMAERAKAVQENYEDRQTTTSEALDTLLKMIEQNEHRKREQAELKLDGLTYFIYNYLKEGGLSDAERVGKDIKEILKEYPDWAHSDKSMREARQKTTFRICRSINNLDKVSEIVDNLFRLLGNPKNKK